MNDIILRINVVGNNDALAGFEAIKKELKDTQALLSKYNRTIKDYEERQTAGLTATKAQTKAYNEAQTMTASLTSKLEQLIIKEGINTNTLIKNNIETQAVTKSKRLEATSVNETVGAYERLNAEYRIAQKELLDLAASGTTSGEAFEQAKTRASTLEASLNNLHRTTGQYGKGANNAYYNTFQLTQVMRELPNFAIDARVGFMSLSNNIPMLVDGFKNLANSVDETGKKLGNTKALKIFASSLLSFNTIMIAGITLMTLFGDDLVDMMFKTESANKVQDDFNKSLKEGNSQYNESIKSLYEANAAIEAYRNGKLSEEEALKKVNQAMGSSVGKFEDLQTAIQWQIDNSNKYLQSMFSQALANAYLQSAVDKRVKADTLAAEEEVTNIQVIGKSFGLLFDYLKDMASNDYLLGGIGKMTKRTIQYFKDMGNAESLVLSERKAKAAKLLDESEKENKIYQDKIAESFNELISISNDLENKTEKTTKNITSAYSKMADIVVLASKGWVDSLGDISTQSEQTANDYARAQKTLLRMQYEADKERLQQEERTALLSEETEQGRLNVKENYRQEHLLLEQKYANDIYSVNLRLASDLYTLEQNNNKLRQQENKDFLDEKAKEIKSFGEQQAEEARRRAEEEVSTEKQKAEDIQTIFQASFQALSQIAGSYTDLLMDNIDREYKARVRSLDEQNDYAESALKERYDKGLISEKKYNKQKEALQRQYEDEKEQADRDAFEKEKSVKIKQAFMELALGIVRTMSQNAFPLNLILSGILTTSTLFQVANIKKQQYANGGRVALGNIPTQPNGDNVLATVKTGEVVLNERQQKALGGDDTFKAIGVPGFADGGLIRPYSPAPIISTQSMIKSNNTNLFEQMRTYIDNRISTLRVVVLESEISQMQGDKKAKIERSTLL